LMRAPHLLVCREASRFFSLETRRRRFSKFLASAGRRWIRLRYPVASRARAHALRSLVARASIPLRLAFPFASHGSFPSHRLPGWFHPRQEGRGGTPALSSPPGVDPYNLGLAPPRGTPQTLDRSDMEASSSSDGDACRFEDSPLLSASSESGGDEVGGAKARGEEAEARVLTQERNARRRGRTRCWRRMRCAGGRWKPWKGCATCLRWRKTWPTRC